jgi:enoyl-CoA hydratase/carnithine racemase
MSEANTNSDVLCDRVSDHVALVTINRPAARNAINYEVTKHLSRIAETIETDPVIWAVVLTGSGSKAFSAGADLREVTAGGLSRLFTPKGGFAGVTRLDRSKTWIAAVNGVAYAGGLEIMLACDFAIAASHSTFGLPEVKRGLLAGAGGTFRLPRSIPRAVALRMLATGDPIDATEARGFGLITEIANTESVVGRAVQLATQVAENAPLAVAASLRLARECYNLTEEQLWHSSAEAQAELSQSDDFKEGPRAFVEKRKPHWKRR